MFAFPWFSTRWADRKNGLCVLPIRPVCTQCQQDEAKALFGTSWIIRTSVSVPGTPPPWFVFGANAPDRQALFQSGWFVEGLLSQTLIIHMIRTAKVPFAQSVASPPLLVLTLVIMAVGVAIPFTPLGAAVGLVPLPWGYFPWLVGTLLAYCALTQAVKAWYVRKFGMWL
jgi:magnesium-transporting ATPase (P-type)